VGDAGVGVERLEVYLEVRILRRRRHFEFLGVLDLEDVGWELRFRATPDSVRREESLVC